MNLIKAEKPTRKAFSERMAEYGKIDKDFVVFEADIGGSTFSYLFGKEYPQRYFNMGIAEQNEASAAAGMAAGGRTVVVCSYGVFLSMRALEMIRSFICYPKLNVKFLASHGGLTAAIDGVTHQATEDIGIMTTLPGMKVFCPCDTYSAGKIFDAAMNTPGPVFNRLMRDPLFDIYTGNEKFTSGGSNVLKKGTDITIVSYGDIIFQALEAAEELEKNGISAEVIDIRSIIPLDKQAILTSVKKTSKALVVHEDKVFAGFGGEIASIIAEEAFEFLDGPVRRVGATFTPVGFNRILEAAILPNADKIYQAAKDLIEY